MTVVTREEIERSGARELADVLGLVPGFQLGGDLYSSVFAGFRGIRGSEGKLLVLLDGHAMFELLYYATELGNRIPVDQIGRIRSSAALDRWSTTARRSRRAPERRPARRCAVGVPRGAPPHVERGLRA